VADGFFHSFSGWVVYIAAFLLLFAVGWLLDKIGSLGAGGGGGGRADQLSKATADDHVESPREASAAATSATAATATPVGLPSVKGAE
jgi:hypothetical protein